MFLRFSRNQQSPFRTTLAAGQNCRKQLVLIYGYCYFYPVLSLPLGSASAYASPQLAVFLGEQVQRKEGISTKISPDLPSAYRTSWQLFSSFQPITGSKFDGWPVIIIESQFVTQV